ncbi:MAG: hypothetical protein M1834_002843 [Cirrosporium novae-zelandiae]|nr:MAG: hypothetical protein M1834_002843 [Cirrosporium novae-zelandiae]
MPRSKLWDLRSNFLSSKFCQIRLVPVPRRPRPLPFISRPRDSLGLCLSQYFRVSTSPLPPLIYGSATICIHIYIQKTIESPADTNISGCEEVMAALDECHARGFLWKVVGGCNDAKTAVNKCLRAQRLERQTANREKAAARTEKYRNTWKEIDANS